MNAETITTLEGAGPGGGVDGLLSEVRARPARISSTLTIVSVRSAPPAPIVRGEGGAEARAQLRDELRVAVEAERWIQAVAPAALAALRA